MTFTSFLLAVCEDTEGMSKPYLISEDDITQTDTNTDSNVNDLRPNSDVVFESTDDDLSITIDMGLTVVSKLRILDKPANNVDTFLVYYVPEDGATTTDGVVSLHIHRSI